MTIARVYGRTTLSLVNGEIDYDTNTVKMALFTTSHVPNQDTDRYFTTLTGEASGTNYTAGGLTVGNKTVNYDAGTNTCTLSTTTNPLVISNITVTNVRYAVFYMDTGSKPLLSYVDFESGYNATAEDFKVGVPTTGLVQFVVA